MEIPTQLLAKSSDVGYNADAFPSLNLRDSYVDTSCETYIRSRENGLFEGLGKIALNTQTA